VETVPMHHAPVLSISLLVAASFAATVGAQAPLPSIEVRPMRGAAE